MTLSKKICERVHWIAEEARHGNWQSFEIRLSPLMLDSKSRIQDLVQSTPRNHDTAALIQEMRHGCNLIDKRFEAIDKRFDDLIHQIDKRFEQVDKRFNRILWMMGIGFTCFSFVITYETFFKQGV